MIIVIPIMLFWAGVFVGWKSQHDKVLELEQWKMTAYKQFPCKRPKIDFKCLKECYDK